MNFQNFEFFLKKFKISSIFNVMVKLDNLMPIVQI